MLADEAAMLDAMRTAVERCRDELSQRADLHFYTTTDAVRDLDAVRQAIGADKINLLGISYGTRAAQQSARAYPQHTRTRLHHSVAPKGTYLGNDSARHHDYTRLMQLAGCGKTPCCAHGQRAEK